MDGDRTIRHGILIDYEIQVQETVQSVLYEPQSDKVALLHSEGCCLYQESCLKDNFFLDSNFNNLLFAEQHGVYVGVSSHHLTLMNANFNIIYEAKSDTEILSSTFNHCSGHVITSSPGKLTVWMFRQGAKVITPSYTVDDGLSPSDEIHNLHLEDVPGRAQRSFAGVGCGIKIFLLEEGKMIMDLKNIHMHPITVTHFFRPLGFLITGAKDGAIKVWNNLWQLQWTFIGHCGPVTAISSFCYGPMIVSSSLDATIRVWNLHMQDQIEVIQHAFPIQALHCKPGNYSFLSYSKKMVTVWKVRKLYSQTAIIGHKIEFLTRTNHPMVPLRVVVISRNSVRIVSPIGGNVITTALLPLETDVTSVAYLPCEEKLFVLEKSGILTLFNCKDNPCCKELQTTQSELGIITSVAVYELFMDEEDIEDMLEEDRWLAVAVQAQKYSHVKSKEDPLSKEKQGTSLLLAGTKKGSLLVLDYKSGGANFSVKAHNDAVSLIACNPNKDQVISTSTDNVVQIWRLYPHSKEVLSLIMSFCAASTPCLMTTTQERLCIAWNKPELATYSIDVYSFCDFACFTGDPESNHDDCITCLDVYRKLRLFVSASDDKTIRLWTQDNQLLRIIQLDYAVQGLVFCSLQGDLMIGLHNHLHVISHALYFSESLMNQLITMQFPDSCEESQKDISAKVSCLTPEDLQRLELVDDTIQQGSYHGALSQEEINSLEKAATEKAHAIFLLQKQKEELLNIREGLLTSSKKHSVSMRAKDREQTWQNLFQILHPKSDLNISIPEEDDCTSDNYGAPLKHSRRSSNFFPLLASFNPPYPIAPDGFLPNSRMLAEFRKTEEDWKLAEEWEPPKLTLKQLQSLENQEEEEQEDEENSERDSELLTRLHDALYAAHSSESSSTPTPPPSPPEPVVRHITPHKKIEKLVAPKAAPKPIPKEKTPPPFSKSPSPPPPPPTPLPEYIAQFIGETWFDKLFPNPDSKTFPPPWTVNKFINILLVQLSKPMNYAMKAGICSGIEKLMQQYDDSCNKDVAYKAVTKELTTPPLLSLQNKEESVFISQALKVIFSTRHLDSTMAPLLAKYYSEGTVNLQQGIMNYFTSLGINDPHGYFAKELKKSCSATSETKFSEWFSQWAEKLMDSKSSKRQQLYDMQPKRKVLKNVSGKGERNTSSKLKVTFKPTAPSYNPIDVVNYFVSVEHEKRNRVPTPPTPEPPPSVQKDRIPCNTVIALPKLNPVPVSLVRLGETHCSLCHPERETSLSLVHRHVAANKPRSTASFSHSLALALKPQYLNPFLTQEEQIEEELQGGDKYKSVSSIMKYFVPEHSYVKSDP